MPRLRRHAPKTRDAIDPGMLQSLLHGREHCNDLELYMMPIDEFDTRAKAAWEFVGGDLLDEWLDDTDNLCSRPWGWWRFTALEQRRQIGGGGSIERRLGDWYFDSDGLGIPRLWYGAVEGEDFAEFETEHDYLARHNLLTRAEKKHLTTLADSQTEKGQA